MNYPALKGGVSDFSSKNLSLDRKLSILRGFIPRNLGIGKNFALKLPRRKAGSWVLHPRFPINQCFLRGFSKASVFGKAALNLGTKIVEGVIGKQRSHGGIHLLRIVPAETDLSAGAHKFA